ncbi:24376_t:CDS:10 [Cetraspora pellucida]|uniref:V-type proton ATPase subunit D n=1 Tax=Cetraspora pellucida TaxID=1433469 RepID=A0A9N9DIQ6_9GLOM|nr:24376_t:CDS:10 [Cetraspora pellucida]
MEALYFNVNDGYLEGIVRGYKSAILNTTHYLNLTQCETLDGINFSNSVHGFTSTDLKLQLSATDYGNFLANEPSPIAASTIHEKATQKLVAEFKYVHNNATQPLSKFLDYLTYAYMIDNVILLITGTLHQRDTNELLERCHPLGKFDTMAALCVATNVTDLYDTVIVETPLAPYFQKLSVNDIDELNIEIIRNTLYKAYLEDFYGYCKRIGGVTGELMCEILEFEADRRTINITINSFDTELSRDDREKLFPSLGKLYPDGHVKLARADCRDHVKTIVEEYRPFFDTTLNSFGGAATSEAKSLDDHFFEYEVHLNKLTFQQQFHYAMFYAFLKLKEQEIRNILWIAEYTNCIIMSNIYSQLPKHVINSPEAKKERQPPVSETTKKFVPNFVMGALEETVKDSAKVYDSKLKDKVLLLDNPLKTSNEKKKRRRSKRKIKSMSAKEKRETRIYEIPKECHRYELFIPLNELWLQYIDELYGTSSPTIFVQKLLKADFHGAILTGINIHETENVFKLITKDNVLKVIPKGHSVFTFLLRDHMFTLYGDQFRFRSAVRAAKKFKNKPTIDL